jgi:hypothetical protein
MTDANLADCIAQMASPPTECENGQGYFNHTADASACSCCTDADPTADLSEFGIVNFMQYTPLSEADTPAAPGDDPAVDELGYWQWECVEPCNNSVTGEVWDSTTEVCECPTDEHFDTDSSECTANATCSLPLVFNTYVNDCACPNGEVYNNVTSVCDLRCDETNGEVW